MTKVYYCPLQDNRQVAEAGGERGYQRVDTLTWTAQEVQHGKVLRLNDFPKQTSGSEGWQCRLARLQRNPIACAILVWVRLNHVA